MPFREEQHNKLLLYLETLDRREREEFLRLSMIWGNISSSLDGMIDRLSNLESLSADQLFRLELYKKFLEDSQVIITTYSNIADGVITEEQEIFAKLGLQSAQDLIGVSFSNKLNINAVRFMVGNTREGTPLFDLLQKSYPETVERITNTLTESMALGRGPRETARLLKQDMDGNLNRALRIARTEQINVFRESQTLQYQASGLVKAKDWVGTADELLCPICQDGISNSPYPLNEIMASHPNCRCGWSPVL
jgi:hypothetical protein